MMNKFIYLKQGKVENVSAYFYLKDRVDCDARFLTYDEPLTGAIFLPNATINIKKEIGVAKILRNYHQRNPTK